VIARRTPWAPAEGNLNGWVYQHAQPPRSDRLPPPLGAHSRAVIAVTSNDSLNTVMVMS